MSELAGRRSEAVKKDVPEGQVTLTSLGAGWWLVQIGRARYVKRFNLSDAEARQLRDLLNNCALTS